MPRRAPTRIMATTTKNLLVLGYTLLTTNLIGSAYGFVSNCNQASCFSISSATNSQMNGLGMVSNDADSDEKVDSVSLPSPSSSVTSTTGRRDVLQNMVKSSSSLFMIGATAFTSSPTIAYAEVQRAVGGAEVACREAGNCLETGQWDGAVGWNWGGKDRCDAADPRCGPDGKLQDTMPVGLPVPEISSNAQITYLAEVTIDVGRSETGIIRLGLYGNDCPGSVQQMVKFLSSPGLATTSSLAFESGMGIESTPVALYKGGVLSTIVPGKLIDFGIPSQSAAYAKLRGSIRGMENFVPQPRPPLSDTQQDLFVRKHDVAGLLSIPAKGMGYAGGTFESDDIIYEDAFQITASAVPEFDKKQDRRVIGQVMDTESMAFLARLAQLPTKKGLKGVIPGQNSGPPLIKVTVRDVQVAAATAKSE